MSGIVDVRPGAGHLPPEVLRLVDDWLPGRRWYPVPGNGVRHVPWLTVTFPHTPDVVVPLLRLEGPGLPDGEAALVVQVPLVLTPTAEPVGPGTEHGLIGTVTTSAGTVSVSDGGAHPVCWLAYLRASSVVGLDEGGGFGAGTALLDGARPMSGEQSNTSVVVPGVAGGAMLKILRTVALGPHPDVTIPEALTRAGWLGVPEFLGAVPITWEPGAGSGAGSGSGSGSGSGPTMAHLAVVSRLVPDAHDGFRLACDYAARGEDFGERAHELGAVVAQMHAALCAALPVDVTLDPAPFVGVLRRRAAEAFADVPALAPFRGPVSALYDEVRERLTALGPGRVTLQTIHGDLHLGQALWSTKGWQLLDFEGEPQRPVSERTAPDLPLRDAAGLLRSFDYAAAVGGAADSRWAEHAKLSFLEGYREASGDGAAGMDLSTAEAVLRALVLDKALYEVVYESRHRPAWAHIPLAAVARVVGS